MANPAHLTQAEACFLVAGSGLGTGILAIPYAARNLGAVQLGLAVAGAFVVSLLLHWLVAELVLRSDGAVQLMAIFRRHLFRGRWGETGARVFFAVLAVLLLLNLTLYLTCAAEVMTETFGWPAPVCKLAFYAAASLLVLPGLKAIGVGESWSMGLILVVLAGLALLTGGRGDGTVPLSAGGLLPTLGLYSLCMFSFSALFSVPQIAAGLGERKKIRRCVALGLAVNALATYLFTLLVKRACALPDPVATTGLARQFGPAVGAVCALLVTLAMLTSFLSISLAQLDMLGEELRLGRRTCWLLATLPVLGAGLVFPLGYRAYIEVIGGVVAIIIALLVLPAYRSAAETDRRPGLLAFLFLAYLLMAVCSFV